MHDGVILRILRCYIQKETISFTDLCNTAQYPTDLGKYYIRRLINKGLLSKTGRGQYTITPSGKQQLIKLEHSQGISASVHPRLCVMVIGEQRERLIVNRRTRQPFLGRVEWPALMVDPGEELVSATERLLVSRLSTETQPTFLGFFRRIDVYKDTIFDDKLFAVHSCKFDASVTVATQSAFAENLSLTVDELTAVANPAKSLHDIYAFTKNPTHYQEHTYNLSLEDIEAAD